LPGKPLTPIAGKSLIRRTYDQCARGFPAERIYVATDDDRIRRHCEEAGIRVVMTSDECLTGTDRVAEAARALGADYVINVQGDEPLCDPADIRLLALAAADRPDRILNGYCPITEEDRFRSPGVPKVVFRPDGRLLYMSRSAIPGSKSGEFDFGYRQVCIYGFPNSQLQTFAEQPAKSPLEATEDIEILRFLELGQEVHMLEMSPNSIAVDYPDDVQRVEAVLKKMPDVV
jgi:3-deoxy-manno-octulosonate cytidylyltransferase (CMP-KDO synthetase)